MTGVKQEYGGAMYLLASDEGLGEALLAQLREVCGLFDENPAYTALLEAPTVSLSEKKELLDAAFAGRVHPYIVSFLKILVEHGYCRFFPDCCAEYEARYNEAHGICTARITSAVPLTDEQRERLRAKLCGILGKRVDMTCTVEPSLLGGVKAELDGILLDGTVKNKMDTIRDNLKNMVI